VTESFAVLRVTGSVGRLGVVLSVQAVVGLGLSLAGGVAGDRWRRGRILVLSTAVRMAAAVVLAVALLSHAASFAVLLAGSVVYGCANGFFGPVSAAVLPDVVPGERLAAANALIGGVSSSVTIVTPALAGAVVAILGPGAGFATEAAALGLAAACLAAARVPATARGTAAQAGLPEQLRTGWHVFWRLRWLWLLTLQWTVFSLLILAPVAVLGPTIAVRYLGGAAAWGVISSCLTIGVVAGQFAVGRLRLNRPALLAACLCPAGVAEALALGLGAPVPVITLMAVISGLAMGAQFVILQTTMQSTVPAPVLARVAAFDLLGSELGQPAGYAIAGPVGAVVGIRLLLTGCAAVAFAAVLPFAAAPALRARRETLSALGAESLEPAALPGRR
jgi:predicted MFS family arabinose efflux permease